MSVHKDKSNNTWYAMIRYNDWTGERRQKCKRGFSTKRDAQAWERSFILQTASDMDMTFKDFFEIYERDLKTRLKENTWLNKEHIILTKIMPYFSDRKMNEVQTRDIIAWQNKMLNYRDEKGRFRSRTIGFRVSPEEEKLINSAVALSGLTKQDYIVKKLTDRTVTVLPNPRVYKALKNQLSAVLDELTRIENGNSVDGELLEVIRLINTTFNSMKGEKE